MQQTAIQEVKVGQQAPQEVHSLVGVVDSSQLGSPEKLTELEKIQLLQRKAEHGMTIPTIKRGLGRWSIFHAADILTLQVYHILEIIDLAINLSFLSVHFSKNTSRTSQEIELKVLNIFPTYGALWIGQKTVYEVAESSDIPLIQCGQNQSYYMYNNHYSCVDTKIFTFS